MCWLTAAGPSTIWATAAVNDSGALEDARQCRVFEGGGFVTEEIWSCC
jgi:hypothetical protein